MDNSVSFKLQLADYASDPLKKFGGSARDVFEGVDKEIGNTQQRFNDLGKPVDIRVNTSEARSAIDELGESMHRLSEMKLIGGMAAGELVARGVERSFDFAKEQVRDILEGGMEESMTKMGINVLAKSEEVGKELFEGIHGYMKKSMYGDELLDQGKLMLQYGMAVKDIVPTLREMGDVAGGSSMKMDILARLLGEVALSGKLMGRENMFLTRETGFSPIAELHRTTGKSVAQLEDMMKEGKITWDMVKGALASATGSGGLFDDYMARVMATPGGQLKMMMTNISSAKKEFGEKLLPAEDELLKAFAPVVDELPETLARLQPSMESFIRSLADGVKWVSAHTDAIGHLAGMTKIAGEAWLVWKAGSAAATAANWLWNASAAAQISETKTATAVIEEENVALVQQGEALESLGLKWASMAASERAAMEAMAANSFNLPINTIGAASAANAQAGAVAGGLIGGVTKAAVPVFVTYFAGEALAQVAKWVGGKSVQDAIGYDEKGNPLDIWDVMGRHEYTKRLIHNERDARADLPGAFRKLTDHLLGQSFEDSFGTGVSMDFKKQLEDDKNKGNEDSDAIIAGGRKVININVKSFVEHWTQYVGSMKEGADEAQPIFEHMVAEVLQSAAETLQ